MTFFSHKKLLPHYINRNRSLVQLLHLMLTRTVAFSSSLILVLQDNYETLPTGWMKLKIAARPAGWPTWRRSTPWSSWSHSCCSSSVSSSQPSRQGAQSAVRKRMRRKRTLKMWYLTENGDNFDRFQNFHKSYQFVTFFQTQKLVPFAIEFSRKLVNFLHHHHHHQHSKEELYISISGCIRFYFLPNNHSVRHSKTHGLDEILNWQLHVMDIFISYCWQWCSDWP